MTTAVLPRTAVATFSVTGGLASEFIARGEMIPWSGTLVVEGGVKTGDRRSIKAGALTHRKLPLPFMVQLENPVGGDGHDGATLTGRIDTLELMDSGRWWATGFIDPTMQDGDTLALALDKQMIRGISVDLDQVSITEVQGQDGTTSQVIEAGRIIGGTATPFAAFAECEIALDLDRMSRPMVAALAASADFTDWEAEFDGAVAAVWSPTDAFETLVAFAGRSIPIDPPAEWFVKPTFSELTPLTVTGNGRVFGHIAAWGTCHISFANKCVPVPRSRTNYAKFRQGSVLTAEGEFVRTGPIVMDTVHPDLRWKASDAMSFYANTGAAVADVIPYEDKFGICVVGAMRPDVAPERIRAFRASDISPDWRHIDGHPRECCALLAVNNSGFKLPIALAASAGMFVEPGDTAIALDAFEEVYALVASGPMSVEPCCAECAAHLVASADDADADPREARVAAMRKRFGTAIVPDKRLDDDERRAAVRARFGPKAARVFRVATFTREGAIKAWLVRHRGDQVDPSKIRQNDVLEGLHDIDGNPLKGPQKVLSIEAVSFDDNRGKTRTRSTRYVADVQGLKTGKITKRVRLNDDDKVTRVYVPGMDDKVTVFQPNPGHGQRRMAYRTFRAPGSEAELPD